MRWADAYRLDYIFIHFSVDSYLSATKNVALQIHAANRAEALCVELHFLIH